MTDNIYKDIMEVMVKHANAPHQYWNPNFLAGVQDLLESYGQLEDVTVGDWIVYEEIINWRGVSE